MRERYHAAGFRVHDSIVTSLAETIFSGTIKPGETLPSEMELCEHFSVSRTTVREAIHVLANKGLVQARRRVGTVVLDPKTWNYLDPGVLKWARQSYPETEFAHALVEALLILEPEVAALAAKHATVQEVADIDRAYRTVASTLPKDPDAFASAELDFHLGLFVASHNIVCYQLITVLRPALEENLRLMPQIILSRRRTIDAHRHVVEAIRLRQADTARQSMQALLEIVRDEVTADIALRRTNVSPPDPVPVPAHLLGVGTPHEEKGLVAQFRSLYGDMPTIHRAPGRVTLIGEHTDYTGGLVLPVALDRFTWVAASPRQDRLIRIHTDTVSEPVILDLDTPSTHPHHDWRDYIHGVAIMLERAGYWLSGANILLRSDLLPGVGLGASASLEVAVAHALCYTTGISVDAHDLARCCQRAENEFVGVRCGIMDPFTVINSQDLSALLLDCATLESQFLPFPGHARLILCNSQVRIPPASSEYNQRRQECERGIALLSDVIPGLRSLRDVTEHHLLEHADYLPETEFRRCRHIVGENARVLRAAEALKTGNLSLFGQLMGESHRSLRNDFQVSCPELDLLVELSLSIDGVYGARMTGSGFGGCIVALMEADTVAPFTQTVKEQYHRITGKVTDIFPCRPCSGASLYPDAGIQTTKAPLLKTFFPKDYHP